jgi:hypothetical protein
MLTHVLVLDQQSLMPKFFNEPAQALIYVELAGVHCLIVWNDQKITDVIELNQEQIQVMSVIESLVQQAVNYDAHVVAEKLLTFDSYLENKVYQQEIVEGCIKRKVCKK